jgi:cyclic beta-1,2-glucan synthetase
LPYALAHYIEVTGDRAVLDEKTPFSVARKLKEGELDFVEEMPFGRDEVSIYEHAKRAIDLVLDHRLGEHGLPLIGKGDWNDGLDRIGHLGKGESVWLGFFLHDVLRKFAALAEQHGDDPSAARYRAATGQLAHNLEVHGWVGDRFARAYTDSGKRLDFNDVIVQAWSVLSGGAARDKAVRAVASAVRDLYKPDGRMILLFDEIFDQQPYGGSIAAYFRGLRENEAQYTHGSSWLPRAVAELGDGDQAVELYKALLPTTHASDPRYGAEPYVVAADIYGHKKMGEGGWTWYSGGPGWIYRTGIEKILGLQFKGGDRLIIDPTIPTSWPGYQATYRKGTARYQIEIKNPSGVSRGVRRLALDGKELDPNGGVPLVDDGREHIVQVLIGPARDGSSRSPARASAE